MALEVVYLSIDNAKIQGFVVTYWVFLILDFQLRWLSMNGHITDGGSLMKLSRTLEKGKYDKVNYTHVGPLLFYLVLKFYQPSYRY